MKIASKQEREKLMAKFATGKLSWPKPKVPSLMETSENTTLVNKLDRVLATRNDAGR